MSNSRAFVDAACRRCGSVESHCLTSIKQDLVPGDIAWSDLVPCTILLESMAWQHSSCGLTLSVTIYTAALFVSTMLQICTMTEHQRSVIHCQIICLIQLLTPNILAGLENTSIHWTLWRLERWHIRGVYITVLHKSTFTYLVTYLIIGLLTLWWR